MMRRVSPWSALMRGLIAGLAGALAQDLFFAATKKIAPAPPKKAFEPPEPQQKQEMPTQTVARRVVEDLMQRGPLDDAKKETAGKIVHYAFGGAWGAVYGLTAGTYAATSTIPASLAFGSLVWAISDNGILPAFKLAAGPHKYPVRSHLYAIAAHLVYGATAYAVFKATARSVVGPIAALIGAARATRAFPSPLRPTARRVVWTVKKGADAFVH